TAIAEVQPSSAVQLARIAGVNRTKLDRFGAEVLALVAGRDPRGADEPAEEVFPVAPEDDVPAPPDDEF
ncbi:MAG: hypothetical protein HOV66_17870, partial [Streptomycetaceae bacterium]|nr:hypothetical protein [Streptomycetaceae bacterium]